MNISKKVAVLFGVVGLAAGTAGAIALQTHAADVSSTATTAQTSSGFRHGTPPAAEGSVTAVSGNTITLTGKNGATYTIDAESAKVKKVSDSDVSNIAVGDTLQVNGSTSGSTVTATNIVDGVMGFGQHGQPATAASPPAN